MSTPRGDYVVNSKGEILVGKPNFVYGTVEGYFSPKWKLYGLSERWNSRPILFEQLREKMDRGQTVEGYVHDIDHGTRRFWGGGKPLPKAKMYLDRSLRVNPPMYAHHLYERKTHGLNLQQMRRLYVMVSRGNKKAITYARNVLGIPFDETPSQVKAVVKHHLIDMGAGRVRRNGSEYRNIQKTSRKNIYTGFAYGIVYRIKPWWNGREYGWEAKVRFPGDLAFVRPDIDSYPIRAMTLADISEKLELIAKRGIERMRAKGIRDNKKKFSLSEDERSYLLMQSRDPYVRRFHSKGSVSSSLFNWKRFSRSPKFRK